MRDTEESLSIQARRSKKEQNVKAKQIAGEWEEKISELVENMGSKGMKREGSRACMVSFSLYPNLEAFSHMAAALGSYYSI